MRPEYIQRNLSRFEPYSDGAKRLLLFYEVKTPEGDRQMLDFLTCDAADEHGVGTYRGVSLDITDWKDEIQRLVDNGELAPAQFP